MATDAGRHKLYEKISTEWGQEHAEELMSYLPPVGWADVANKQDLKLLSAELRAEIHKGFADQRDAFADQLRWTLGIVLTAFIGLTGVFAAIVNWLG